MKWSGYIGYSVIKEDPADSGIYKSVFTERKYYGDLIDNYKRTQDAGQVNDDIVISNKFSIIADPFALSNFHNMKYVTFMGFKWKIKSIDVQPPRLIISAGEVYNGEGGPEYE